MAATYTISGKGLDAAVTEQMIGGYRVLERTETGATMAKAKSFNFGAFLLLTLCGIIPGILYVGWYASKSDSMLRLTASSTGAVTYNFH